MSEPVGNGPRTPNIPGNSIKGRETPAPQAPKAEPAAREKVEKIVEGRVVVRKTPWWKRAAGSMIADDATSVGDYLLVDVVVPAMKNLIRDVIVGGVDRSLYGSARNPRAGISQTIGRTIVSGTSLRNQYNNVPAEPARRMMGAEAMAKHDFTDVVLGDREEAVGVINGLISQLTEYGSVTVSDLYDFVGVTGSFADRKWGWYNLDAADIRQVRGGFLLDLPRPQPLR